MGPRFFGEHTTIGVRFARRIFETRERETDRIPGTVRRAHGFQVWEGRVRRPHQPEVG